MKLKTPRPAESYRAARRCAWRQHNTDSQIGPMAWNDFNKPFPSGSNFGIGSLPETRGDIILRNKFGAIVRRRPRLPVQGRSKYMPHIGAKQRAKAALKSGVAP